MRTNRNRALAPVQHVIAAYLILALGIAYALVLSAQFGVQSGAYPILGTLVGSAALAAHIDGRIGDVDRSRGRRKSSIYPAVPAGWIAEAKR